MAISPTNYSSGRFFDSGLMLPTGGGRFYEDGHLSGRGMFGGYWASTEISTDLVWNTGFSDTEFGTYESAYKHGAISVRCIEDITGQVSAINCESSIQSIALTVGVSATNVEVSVPYTGGNGGYYGGQGISSGGVTGSGPTLHLAPLQKDQEH
jgi:hypothetical protein